MSEDRTSGGPGRPEPATMAYEAARDELLEVVRRLESGGADLEESLGLWERGEQLAARCQEVLDGALRRLDDVRPAEPGEPGRSARSAQAGQPEESAADSSSTTSTR